MSAKTGPDGQLISSMKNEALVKSLATAKKKVAAKIKTELVKRKVTIEG